MDVATVTLDKTNEEVFIGDSLVLTAVVAPDNATYNTVVWKTSDKNIATVNNGVVTTVGVGSATITAISDEQSATCEVKVKSIPVTDITINHPTATLVVGDSLVLTAVVAPDNATDKTVTWTTSEVKVAIVEDGVVTAVGAGTATITAKAGDKTATCSVVVEWPAGIDGIKENAEVVIYDLKGNILTNQKNLGQGVYIINGVKTVVK